MTFSLFGNNCKFCGLASLLGRKGGTWSGLPISYNVFEPSDKSSAKRDKRVVRAKALWEQQFQRFYPSFASRAFVVALQRQMYTYRCLIGRTLIIRWPGWNVNTNSGCATTCGRMAHLLDQMIVLTYNILTCLITFFLAPLFLAWWLSIEFKFFDIEVNKEKSNENWIPERSSG